MPSDYSPDARSFLVQLYKITEGDHSKQASMYTIGEAIGLDKSTAADIAQELMGAALVDIRTLAGGVGINPAGIAEIERLGLGPAVRQDNRPRLGDQLVISEQVQGALAELTISIKHQAGKLGLEFEDLCELMADLKTIDSQMASSKPKTAIIRAVLVSLLALLERVDAVVGRDEIKVLIG